MEPVANFVPEEKTSKYWFAKAEAIESGEGHFLLGNALIEGNVIPANPPEGFDRLEKAVAMGWTPALVPLGDCHYQGLATRRDHVKAHDLLPSRREGRRIGSSLSARPSIHERPWRGAGPGAWCQFVQKRSGSG